MKTYDKDFLTEKAQELSVIRDTTIERLLPKPHLQVGGVSVPV